MPLDERNVPLPPDNDGNEDGLASQSTNRYLPPRYQSGDNSPLPPDPPGREDIMARLIRESAGRRDDSPVTDRSRRTGHISRFAI